MYRSYVKSGYKKLEQIRNRMIEQDKFVLNRRGKGGKIIRHKDGSPSIRTWDTALEENKVISTFKLEYKKGGKEKKVIRIRFQEFVLSSIALRDSFCLMSDPSSNYSVARGNGRAWSSLKIVQVKEITVSPVDGEVFIVGLEFLRKDPFYVAPEDSRTQQVYVFSDPSPFPMSFPVRCVMGKLYAIPRFSKLKPAVVDVKNELVMGELFGEKFEKVTEWVGIALRHSCATGYTSLY